MKLRALSYCLIALLASTACHTPPVPPEVGKAEIQFSDLRKAGVPVYFPEEFKEYENLTREAKTGFFETKARFSWFRNYEKTTADFSSLLEKGDILLNQTETFKKEVTGSGSVRVRILRERMKNIRKVGLLIRDGKYSRSILAKAELLVVEGESLLEKGEFNDADNKLSRAEIYVDDSANFLMSGLERYNDPALIKEWNKSAEETINLSRKENSLAIVVSKIDQTLTLYKNGRAVMTCTVSVGRNGLYDKKHAGDYATPEGRYKIIKKNPNSLYYKALLIDYPNSADRQAYAKNKKEGLVPSGVGIGGIIEIHGGGNNVITDGCVSMNNQEMDTLYKLVDTGTAVTIIGSKKNLKSILEQGYEH